MTIRPEHLRSIVSRIEELDAQIAALNGDKADAYQEAKGAKADVAALRLVIAERRRREKDPSKFEILQGTAEEYRAILDGGTVVATRARARPAAQKSPAGASSPHATDGDPVTACGLSPRAVPAVETDADWERHDGAATFFLGHAVAGGKEAHPGEPDTAKTLATIEAINREAIGKVRAKAERHGVPDLARMSEAELVERAMAENPAQPWRVG